jgi:hypothetical protein
VLTNKARFIAVSFGADVSGEIVGPLFGILFHAFAGLVLAEFRRQGVLAYAKRNLERIRMISNQMLGT